MLGSKNSSTEEWSQPANIGRRQSITAEQDNLTQTRRQSIANRMLPNSLPDALVSAPMPQVVLPARNELSSSSRFSTLNEEDFYGSRPATRASSGQRNGERQFRGLKSRSPSPVRWTAVNSSWKEERAWETSLTFPKDGKKKATVDARDIERLDEGEFLNDNLIAFYLRYHEDCLEKSRPKLAQRIYFHNTFFYETLTKGRIRSNNINYDAVKRWTSKVDLFSYDYIVVPVCEKLHWYVAIICNAPRLLQPDTLDVPKSQDTAEHEMLPLKATPSPALEEGNDDPEPSKTLDNSNEAAEPKSASPSVIAQVEQMSLEDQEQEWPEPDAMPDVPRSRIAQLRSLRTADELNDDPIVDNGLQNQGQSEYIRPKGKKPKRKSMPPVRKYDPCDPRIITLDSLGQAHSPTCSNLKEYLVCEAKERRNVDIVPGRLGMTAKGLPQQSNYCDCGVFVLGYIEKFLKNPDEFVYNILQGDMAGNKAEVKIEASQMRGEIRELIFRLHAEQIQDEKGRNESRSKGKKTASTEVHWKVSGEFLNGKSHLADSKSSKIVETEAEPNDLNPTESAMRQPVARSVTSKVGDGTRARTPETRQHSSAAANGYESGPAEEMDPHSINISRTKRSRHLSKSATTPVVGTEDSEIMETPPPSVEDEPTLATKKSLSRNKDYFISPNSTDTSIPLDSPMHPASSEVKWLTSPNRKAERGSRTHNTFKEFAKISNSLIQNTSHKSRSEKTPENSPTELNDSQKGHPLEVHETPPRQRDREPSFEDFLELPSKYRKSNALVIDADHSPEPRVLRRKGARR
jgi:Ulp1 family protease